MKKTLFGIMIGMVLMIPCVSFADGIANIVGKQVEGMLHLKLNMKDSHKYLIVIDGTSYISVRDAAELWGYDVFYDDTDKEVDLISKNYDPKVKGNTIDMQTITK